MIRPPTICVLGGGISGLSVAYFLQENFWKLLQNRIKTNTIDKYENTISHKPKIILLETDSRLGGKIQTYKDQNILLEKGTKYLQLGLTGGEILSLFNKLHISGDVIPATKYVSHRRFLYKKNSLKSLPSRMDFLNYFFCFVFEILKKHKEVWNDDVSIYDFFCYKFNEKFTREILDPLFSSFFFGDIKNMSVRAYMPLLWCLSKAYDSIILGSLIHRKNEARIKASECINENFRIKKTFKWEEVNFHDSIYTLIQQNAGRFFTLRGGIKQIIDALTNELRYPRNNNLPVQVNTNSKVLRFLSNKKPSTKNLFYQAIDEYNQCNQDNNTKIIEDDKENYPITVEVEDGRMINADLIISTISANDLSIILKNSLSSLYNDNETLNNNTINNKYASLNFFSDSISSSFSSGASLNLFQNVQKNIIKILQEIRLISIATVNFAFQKNVLNWKYQMGGGYYCNSKENEGIIGMSFDSVLFKEHNYRYETRLGGLFRDDHDEGLSEEIVVRRALNALIKHLKINEKPDLICAELYKDKVPVYQVSHVNKINELNELRHYIYPWLHLLGDSFYGNTIHDCIQHARILAKNICYRCSTFPKIIKEKKSDWEILGGGRFIVTK